MKFDNKIVLTSVLFDQYLHSSYIFLVMEMVEKGNLNWHTFSEHLQSMFKELYRYGRHSDLTLVSEDQAQFKAHKIVLSACSPVFKRIIDSNPSQHPLIYLRGIQSYEMESILQFMYLGEARFYCGRLRKFLKVAQELEVKEISDGVVLGNEVEKESGEGEYFEEEKYSEVENKSEQEKPGEETASPTKQSEESRKMFECPDCGEKYRERRSMMSHYRNKHQWTKGRVQKYLLCNLVDFSINGWVGSIKA